MKRSLSLLYIAFMITAACSGESAKHVTAPEAQSQPETAEDGGLEADHGVDADHCENEDTFHALGCVKASAAQLKVVNSGNAKKTKFYNECVRATGSSKWCTQVMRPNPSSKSIFACTYGASQVHQLIHPTESTWKNAYEAIRLIQDLESSGFRVSQIYNWWRPEPYNKNVGGAAGRHPFGTSIDVRFETNSMADKAFLQLCRYRKQGRIRALGHYGTNALHFGVGDKTANTWGKTCP